MKTGNVLWLVYERAGHAENVCYPASMEEVEFVLEQMERGLSERLRVSESLQNYLFEEERRGVFERRMIPVRGANSLYRLIPWRLASWLMRGLRAEGSARERVRLRMLRWVAMQGAGESSLIPWLTTAG